MLKSAINYRSRLSDFKVTKTEVAGLEGVQLKNVVPSTWNYRVKCNGKLERIHYQVVVFD